MKPKTVRMFAGVALPIALGSFNPAQEEDCPETDVTIRLCSDFSSMLARPMDDLPFEQYPTRAGRVSHILASGVSSIAANRPVITLAGEGVNWNWND